MKKIDLSPEKIENTIYALRGINKSVTIYAANLIEYYRAKCEGVTPFIKNRQDREFEWQVRFHENIKKIGEQTGGDEG